MYFDPAIHSINTCIAGEPNDQNILTSNQLVKKEFVSASLWKLVPTQIYQSLIYKFQNLYSLEYKLSVKEDQKKN